MAAPETFRELADLFDKGWRIRNMAVDVREDRQFVRLELKRVCPCYCHAEGYPEMVQALCRHEEHGK